MKTTPECARPCGAATEPVRPPSIDRRMVLRAGAAGSFMAVALPLACGQGASTPSGPIAAGNVSAIAIGALVVMLGSNVVLGRDSQGLYAMSAVCTHAGCTLANSSSGTGLFCGCHSSAFDRNGVVTQGPAQRNLQHYQVDVAADGAITVQGGMPISSTARTAV
jgi:Rieske Fe-S protein